MFERILQLLLIACGHKKISKPFAAASETSDRGDWEAVATPTRHYVVCLECGKKFAYDWNEMRVVR